MHMPQRSRVYTAGIAAGLVILAASVSAQNPAVPPSPTPAPANAAPFVPKPILQGGEIFALYPPNSPFLNQARIGEAEQNNMSTGVPGRIQSIVNIHNPTIELHRVERSINTGTAVIVAAGGGHNTLNVGTEGADFVPFFYNYGVTTIILRNRLRRDGYNPQTDAVYDTQQAIRMVRFHAKEWGIDPNKIGVMGFSAGAELAAPAALAFETFDRANSAANDPLRGVSSRPDFIGLVYPGPTPFTRTPETVIPKNTPPAFIICAGRDDLNHAIWANDYFAAMLRARIPNVEMHIYGNGRHPGDPLPDGSRMTGGLTARNGIPFGTWQYRFIDWFRDLGFLDKPGVETKAAKDVMAHVTAPPPAPRGQGGRGRGAGAGDGRGGAPAGAPAPAAPAPAAPAPAAPAPARPAGQ